MEQSEKGDTGVRRAMQLEALKHDLSKARPLKELVLGEIKSGVDPKWIAIKYAAYGVTLERVLAAKVAIDKQTEKQRERENAMRGNQEAPQSGSFVDGSGGAEQVRVDETRCADMGLEEAGNAHREAHG